MAILSSLIIHEKNTKEIIAVKESVYVIQHTWIFTKLLPHISRLIQHLYKVINLDMFRILGQCLLYLFVRVYADLGTMKTVNFWYNEAIVHYNVASPKHSTVLLKY